MTNIEYQTPSNDSKTSKTSKATPPNIAFACAGCIAFIDVLVAVMSLTLGPSANKLCELLTELSWGWIFPLVALTGVIFSIIGLFGPKKLRSVIALITVIVIFLLSFLVLMMIGMQRMTNQGKNPWL